MSYYAVTYSRSLSHHGIKGQEWGKRNGPPYPLDADDHSTSEKKAGWRRSLDKDPKIHLTDKQKKYLKIGAAVAVTGLAVYGAYKLGAFNAIGKIPVGITGIKSNIVENSVKEIVKGSTADILQSVDKNSWKDAKSSFNRLQQIFNEGRAYTSGDSYDENLKIQELAHKFNTENLFSKVQYDTMNEFEKKSINYYTTQAYTEINSYLRDGKEPSYLAKMAAKNMASALDKTALPKDVYVHRGVGNDLDKVGKMLGVSKETLMISDVSELKSKLVGKTFLEKGFMSCGGAEADAWPGVKLHINVPKGAKGMYIAPVSAKEAEHEFLLQRGSEFLINGVKRDRAGFLELYISLIDQQ